MSYLSARTGRHLPLELSRGGERIEIQGRFVVAVNESNAHLAAAVAGLGVVQTFTFMAQPHTKRGELVPILAEWETDPHSIYVVYPPNRHLSARLRAFVDWLAGLDYSRTETE